MRITACFVTRNHAHILPRALRAASAVADETIVADTGSTDGTVEAATAGGAKLVAVRWADDFAAASNAALAAATGDWVLWLNPDEILEPTAGPALTQLVRNERVFAYALPVLHQLTADQPDQLAMDDQPRLYRRHPDIRYRGRLHPNLNPPLAELAAATGQELAVAPMEAAIRRLAFLSPVTPDKVQWTNRLLRAELADHPDRLDLLIELGCNLLRVNDLEGHTILGTAADRLPTGDRPPIPNAGQLLEYLLSTDPAAVRGRLDRSTARELAARWYPHTPPVVWAVAAERFQAGDYGAAAHNLTRLLEMGRTGRFDRSAPFDPDLVGPMAALNLAVALARLGRRDEARATLAPLAGHPNYRQKAAAVARVIG